MDVDGAALREIFSATTGIWTIAAVLMLGVWRVWNGLPAVMQQWIAWRAQKAAERAAREKVVQDARDGDWKRLRGELDRLANRVADLEKKVEECESDRLHWMGRALAAEAVQLGQGRVRQAAAEAAAVVRLEEAQKTAKKSAE